MKRAGMGGTSVKAPRRLARRCPGLGGAARSRVREGRVPNRVIRAHHAVTDELPPPTEVMARRKEHTSAYGRVGVGVRFFR